MKKAFSYISNIFVEGIDDILRDQLENREDIPKFMSVLIVAVIFFVFIIPYFLYTIYYDIKEQYYKWRTPSKFDIGDEVLFGKTRPNKFEVIEKEFYLFGSHPVWYYKIKNKENGEEPDNTFLSSLGIKEDQLTYPKFLQREKDIDLVLK